MGSAARAGSAPGARGAPGLARPESPGAAELSTASTDQGDETHTRGLGERPGQVRRCSVTRRCSRRAPSEEHRPWGPEETAAPEVRGQGSEAGSPGKVFPLYLFMSVVCGWGEGDESFQVAIRSGQSLGF